MRAFDIEAARFHPLEHRLHLPPQFVHLKRFLRIAVRDKDLQFRPDSSIVRGLISCDFTDRTRLEEIRTLRESSRLQQVRAVDTVVGKEVNVLRWWQTALMRMGVFSIVLLLIKHLFMKPK